MEHSGVLDSGWRGTMPFKIYPMGGCMWGGTRPGDMRDLFGPFLSFNNQFESNAFERHGGDTVAYWVTRPSPITHADAIAIIDATVYALRLPPPSAVALESQGRRFPPGFDMRANTDSAAIST